MAYLLSCLSGAWMLAGLLLVLNFGSLNHESIIFYTIVLSFFGGCSFYYITDNFPIRQGSTTRTANWKLLIYYTIATCIVCAITKMPIGLSDEVFVMRNYLIICMVILSANIIFKSLLHINNPRTIHGSSVLTLVLQIAVFLISAVAVGISLYQKYAWYYIVLCATPWGIYLLINSKYIHHKELKAFLYRLFGMLFGALTFAQIMTINMSDLRIAVARLPFSAFILSGLLSITYITASFVQTEQRKA